MDEKIIIREYESPCGRLMLGSLCGKLCLCDWQEALHRDRVLSRLRKHLKTEFHEGSSAVIELAVKQLNEYFSGERIEFEIPLMFVGTDFQKLVWNELLSIPYGKTISYRELAANIGRPESVRAVANANGANSLSIFTPCHRVVGSDGTLTGYAGGLPAKQYLLSLETTRR